MLGAQVSGLNEAQRREILPQTLLTLMRDTGVPSDLGALGYTGEEVPVLVEGALKQQRLLVNSPRAVGAEELRQLIEQSFEAAP